MSGEALYAAQRLFTIWVHRPPGAAASPPGSIFHGRDIFERHGPPGDRHDLARQPALINLN
jgi:hypothetical protein